MRIGIDIDNVIAETVPSLLPEINKTFKTNLKYKDIYMYDFHIILGISDKEMKHRFWKRLFVRKLFAHMDTVNHAREIINLLYQKHKIILVTDRPKELIHSTKRWLQKKRIQYHNIRHMTGGFKNKHDYAQYEKIRGFGFDVFIEDKLEDAILLAKHCNKVLLYKRPWNNNKNIKKSFMEVNNWNEIIKLLNV